MSLWDRFDGIASVDEVVEAKANQYEPPAEGDYTAKLEELTPAESQNGLPMLKGKFRKVDDNKVIFYNQMLQNLNYPDMTAKLIAEAVSAVSELLGEEIEFKGLSALAETVSTVPMGGTYDIRVSYRKNDTEKKFPQVKILGKTIELVDEDKPPFEA